jgi:hypothetical protein
VKEVNNVDFVALNGTGDEENNVDACCDCDCDTLFHKIKFIIFFI